MSSYPRPRGELGRAPCQKESPGELCDERTSLHAREAGLGPGRVRHARQETWLRAILRLCPLSRDDDPIDLKAPPMAELNGVVPSRDAGRDEAQCSPDATRLGRSACCPQPVSPLPQDLHSVVPLAFHSHPQSRSSAVKSREHRAATAVVIGPGRHFGRELARALQDRYSSVVVASSNAPNSTSDGNHFRPLDVTDHEAVEAFFRDLAEHFPPVGVVVYNVKVSSKGPALDLDPQAFSSDLDTNLGGALSVIQSAVKNRTGRKHLTILVTGGGFKDKPDEGRLGLSVAKAGIHTLVLSLAQRLYSEGVCLKTLIIDGVVRERGPLTPELVVREMLALIESSQRVRKLDIARKYRFEQRTLFDNAS